MEHLTRHPQNIVIAIRTILSYKQSRISCLIHQSHSKWHDRALIHVNPYLDSQMILNIRSALFSIAKHMLLTQIVKIIWKMKIQANLSLQIRRIICGHKWLPKAHLKQNHGENSITWSLLSGKSKIFSIRNVLNSSSFWTYEITVPWYTDLMSL